MKLIGSSVEEEAFQKMAEDLGIQDRVTFLGHLPHDQVLDQMAVSKILVIPSKVEAFGLTALEGVSQKDLVIALNAGGLSEVIQDGVTGLLFESEDQEDQAEKAVQGVLHYTKMHKLIENGYTSVSRFSWENTRKGYEQVNSRLTER